MTFCGRLTGSLKWGLRWRLLVRVPAALTFRRPQLRTLKTIVDYRLITNECNFRESKTFMYVPGSTPLFSILLKPGNDVSPVPVFGLRARR